MRIFLIGFMGSGKSTVGKILAKKLSHTFIDMDDYIVQAEKMEITEIFKTFGESHFRELEKKALHNISEKDDAVIAAGGGTPCFFDNIKCMNDAGKTIYLQISPNEFVARVFDPNTKRPLLIGKTKSELESYATEMLDKRNPFYKQAKVTIDTDNISPDHIVELIMEVVKQ